MKPALKFFQEVGRDFLASRTRALLADQMRLGKTVQAITACDKVEAQTVLVVCPAVAQSVWRDHFGMWSERYGRGLRPAIVSYDYAREHEELKAGPAWDVLILDESHYLKNMQAKRTQTVFAKGGLAYRAKRIWCLSGTPAPNNAGELYVMLKVFGIIKMRYYDFVNYFCTTDGDGKATGTRLDHIAELKALLKQCTLRRLKKDVAPELPACEIGIYPVKSSTRFLEAVDPITGNDLRAKAAQESAHLLNSLKKLKPEQQSIFLAGAVDEYATLRRVNALLKLDALYSIIKQEITEGVLEKLVVYCYHREPIALLQKVLPQHGIRVGTIHGGVSQKSRDNAITNFNRPLNKNGTHVMLCQINAAGVAIDLSAAHEGIALEEDWVPGNNAQAFERMGGYKQTNPITIRKLVLEGGVDSMIAETLTRKEKELSALFN